MTRKTERARRYVHRDLNRVVSAVSASLHGTMTHGELRVSSRPRHGRRFEPVAERSLQADAVQAMETLRRSSSEVWMLSEVAGPVGVADFVAVIGPEQALAERFALGVPPLLNEADAGIVSAASARVGRTVEQIAARLEWSPATVERRLATLLRIGALRETRAGTFIRPAALRPLGRLIAVETKMRDWRRALRQAHRYRLWCDNYVIVMPELANGARDGARAAVRADGGGLFVSARWVLRPRGRAAPDHRRLWGSEYVAAAMGLTGGATSPLSPRTAATQRAAR
jgi:hypothetical protein